MMADTFPRYSRRIVHRLGTAVITFVLGQRPKQLRGRCFEAGSVGLVWMYCHAAVRECAPCCSRAARRCRCIAAVDTSARGALRHIASPIGHQHRARVSSAPLGSRAWQPFPTAKHGIQLRQALVVQF